MTQVPWLAAEIDEFTRSGETFDYVNESVASIEDVRRVIGAVADAKNPLDIAKEAGAAARFGVCGSADGGIKQGL